MQDATGPKAVKGIGDEECDGISSESEAWDDD